MDETVNATIPAISSMPGANTMGFIDGSKPLKLTPVWIDPTSSSHTSSDLLGGGGVNSLGGISPLWQEPVGGSPTFPTFTKSTNVSVDQPYKFNGPYLGADKDTNVRGDRGSFQDLGSNYNYNSEISTDNTAAAGLGGNYAFYNTGIAEVNSGDLRDALQGLYNNDSWLVNNVNSYQTADLGAGYADIAKGFGLATVAAAAVVTSAAGLASLVGGNPVGLAAAITAGYTATQASEKAYGAFTDPNALSAFGDMWDSMEQTDEEMYSGGGWPAPNIVRGATSGFHPGADVISSLKANHPNVLLHT